MGEPDFEGEYEERLKLDVTTTVYAAQWGEGLFRDRATLTTRSIRKQTERDHRERILGPSTQERGIHGLLVERVRVLLPRFPERAR